MAVAARDLGLAESQIYGWRQRHRLEGLTTEEQKLQHAELARLKRELARVEEGNLCLHSSLNHHRHRTGPDPGVVMYGICCWVPDT